MLPLAITKISTANGTDWFAEFESTNDLPLGVAKWFCAVASSEQLGQRQQVVA
jgi:hypothetical protein